MDIFSKYPKYLNNSTYLPDAVMKWAGLDNKNPTVNNNARLSELNDLGIPFTDIANRIEQYL